MWRSILSIAVLSAFVVLPEAAWGGIITIPVPDLLGTYDCPGFWSFGSRQTVVELPNDFANARLIVRGIMTPGLVRGDGIKRAAQEALLMGSWGPCFFLRQNIDSQPKFPPGPESGPFTLEIELLASTYIFPSPDDPPEVLYLSLAPFISVYLVPWLVEEPEPNYRFLRWDEGLEMVTPPTATITEAYWEVVVPEPATLSLLALGGLAILGRGRSNRR